MIAFSYICIMWINVCACLLSAGADISVSGHVGSAVILPCNLQSADAGTPRIRWSIDSETVFERRGKDSYQGEGYEGRVDVPEEELRKGDCSLLIKNLTLADADVYTSYLRVRRSKRSATSVLISSVNLSVDAPPSPTKEANGNRLSVLKDHATVASPHSYIMVLLLLWWLNNL